MNRLFSVTDEQLSKVLNHLFDLERRLRSQRKKPGKIDPHNVTMVLQMLQVGKMATELTQDVVRAIFKERLTWWEALYSKMDRHYDFSNLHIPLPHHPFDRLMVVGDGLTEQKVWNYCKKLFECTMHGKSFSSVEMESERIPYGKSYALWIEHEPSLNSFAAYQALTGNDISASKCWQKKIPTMTMLERLLYELDYFSETGKHLDPHGSTICAGTKVNGTFVPTITSDPRPGIALDLYGDSDHSGTWYCPRVVAY